MPDLPDLHPYEQWWREHAPRPVAGDAADDWYRIEAAAGGKKKRATVWIYDRIGRSFFEDGTDAKSFRRKLAALDVDEIELHLNSPGGIAFDGITIYNSLRDHKAAVHVVVDGLAASAASLIAQAGDTVKMNQAAQMMIHRSQGMAHGNAEIMLQAFDTLQKMDKSIAGIYAARAGGPVDDWIQAMSKETWYTAEEAVEAGLADETVAAEPKEPKARNAFDLRIFNYAGRASAPPPLRIQTQAPAGPSADPPSSQEGAGMDPAKLREALGLSADASDSDVTAAITAAGLVKASAPPEPKPGDPPTPPNPTDPDKDEGKEPTLPPKVTVAGQGSDAVLLDPAQFRALQAQAVRGDEAYRKMKEAECETVLDAAIKAGKFPPARRDHWKSLWAADPDGTKATIDRLAPNVIPVTLDGYPGVGDETEQELIYNAMYPPDKSGAGRG